MPEIKKDKTYPDSCTECGEYNTDLICPECAAKNCRNKVKDLLAYTEDKLEQLI